VGKIELEPSVSIVIPTKNSAHTIEKCLRSVREQSYQNSEVIVVDTESTDDTLNIAARMGCRVISTDWKLLGARYRGFKAANGHYVLMLDSDQILESKAIERATSLAEKYDMLHLEEMSYESKTVMEKMYQADRRLIHKEFEVQKDPLCGTLLARFYRRDILERAFKRIPEVLFPFVIAHDHAIIYYEACKISTNVGALPSALWHVEPKSLIEVWQKNFRYGKSTRKLLEEGTYRYLVRNKTRLRKVRHRISTDEILSIFLLLAKAPPYFIGLNL
jgi:glycosyltransferase involved in cell wall biosynthesis